MPASKNEHAGGLAQRDGGRSSCRGPWRVGLPAAGIAFGLYALTCSPGVVWQDSGVHQFRIVTGLIENPHGLALSHPLHYWLGRAALHLPIGDPVFRLNLLSGLFGAVGVGMVVGLVVALTRRVVAGCLAGAALALAHSYWQMSVVTESYTLAAALMTIEWGLLLRYTRTRNPWLLVAVFAVNGLHVADHLLGLLTLSTYGVLLVERVLRRKLSPRWFLPAGAAWFIAAAPYWLLVWEHYDRVGDLPLTIHSALFGGATAEGGWAGAVLSVAVSWKQVQAAAMTFGYNFPSLVPLVALFGFLRVYRGRRRLFRSVLIAQTLIIGVFVGRYGIVDLYTFFVPVCATVALWFGLGADRMLRRRSGEPRGRALVAGLAACVILPVLVYIWFPALARERGWLAGRMRDIAFRDEYAHFFQPWKHGDHSAADFARAALARSGSGGWLLGDATTAFSTACEYELRGGPENVSIYSQRMCLTDPDQPRLTARELEQHLQSGGKVVAIPSAYVKREWGTQFSLHEDGPFWQVRTVDAVRSQQPTP